MRVNLDFDKVTKERKEKPDDTQYTDSYLLYIVDSWESYKKAEEKRLLKLKTEKKRQECKDYITHASEVIDFIYEILEEEPEETEEDKTERAIQEMKLAATECIAKINDNFNELIRIARYKPEH